MTIEQFLEQLKALLRKAEEAKLDMNEVCEVAEHILQNGWDE